MASMTSSNICTIRLLNKTYHIKCPHEETDNLNLAAQKLNDELLANKKKFQNLDPFQVLLLSALNISHELIVSLKRQEQQRNQVTEFISSLETKINHTVHGEPRFAPETD